MIHYSIRHTIRLMIPFLVIIIFATTNYSINGLITQLITIIVFYLISFIGPTIITTDKEGIKYEGKKYPGTTCTQKKH